MRQRGALIMAGVAALAVVGAGPAPALPDVVPPPVAAAFESVVGVRVREVVRVPVFRAGRFRREPVEGIGAGSGVVVSADSVLTNAHVVAGSAEVHVRTSDGREAPARVVSIDPASDLALLRVAGLTLRPVPFAADEDLAAHDAAFVMGHRQADGPEIAWGRIGSHRRVRVGSRPLEFWCEIEAPIGPGNSGGALLNGRGELIGIPSLLVTYAGVSFAARRTSGLFIPGHHARRSLRRMLAGTRARWPWIGVLLEDALLAAAEGRAADERVRVRSVMAGSPAAGAGVRAGDRIAAIDGRPVRDHFAALDAVLDVEIGATVALTIERAGENLALEIETAARPDDPRPDPTDDFALHTGLRISRPEAAEGGGAPLAFAGMSPRARRDMAAFEAKLFDEKPLLGAILPGQHLLAGGGRTIPITSTADLARAVARCFVEEQFVAFVHWGLSGRRTVDRAHVHRKIYPVVL